MGCVEDDDDVGFLRLGGEGKKKKEGGVLEDGN